MKFEFVKRQKMQTGYITKQNERRFAGLIYKMKYYNLKIKSRLFKARNQKC